MLNSGEDFVATAGEATCNVDATASMVLRSLRHPIDSFPVRSDAGGEPQYLSRDPPKKSHLTVSDKKALRFLNENLSRKFHLFSAEGSGVSDLLRASQLPDNFCINQPRSVIRSLSDNVWSGPGTRPRSHPHPNLVKHFHGDFCT